VKRYLKLNDKFSKPSNETKCLIFDDTEIVKTGKAIEGVLKIHSHVTRSFNFGFKLLVACYWNGSVFIPVDFSFHRKNKNNAKNRYGLSKKEYKNQKKTKRGIRRSRLTGFYHMGFVGRHKWSYRKYF